MEGNLRNGSFYAQIPVGPEQQYEENLNNGCYSVYPKYLNIKNYLNYTVPLITQNELADGWTHVNPGSKPYIVKYTDSEDVQHRKCINYVYRLKVTLAQLPENIWHKMRYNNETSYYAKHGMYEYYIETTPVDSEIRELYYLTKQMKSEEHKERVFELLNVLKDNDVYGWVVIRARNMYKH
jgi:hypothetical protein